MRYAFYPDSKVSECIRNNVDKLIYGELVQYGIDPEQMEMHKDELTLCIKSIAKKCWNSKPVRARDKLMNIAHTSKRLASTPEQRDRWTTNKAKDFFDNCTVEQQEMLLALINPKK